ncbi:MAG TPA: rhomboid family intramembrane serine protease [Kofleriaceae bacterium]|nr:rhomboid family intramembrane serine protease [Kofleriaceae bacterium]
MKLRSRFAGLRITRGALIVAGLELGLSLVWLLSDPGSQDWMSRWLEATPAGVFEHGRVWTLATGVFLERNFLALVLHMMVLWMFVPTLERFWGTPRFYRFVAITSLAGTVAGCAFGLAAREMHAAVSGLDPFIYASIVAFGIVYARQPVQFFGVLPLTGRQLMYGILGFLAFSVIIQQHWMLGVAYAASTLAAAILTSKRWSPGLAWKRWRIARARARLKVMTGGKSPPSKPRDENKWLN